MNWPFTLCGRDLIFNQPLLVMRTLDTKRKKTWTSLLSVHVCPSILTGILKIPILSVWYYRLPFHSNIETQVRSP